MNDLVPQPRGQKNPLASDLDDILSHTPSLDEELRGQRVFLTGGTGFFGCWILESLLWANEKLSLDAQVAVLTRSPSSFVQKAPHIACNPAVQLLSGDIRSFEFPTGHFSYVIHAATESGSPTQAGYSLSVLDTIISGTRRTLDFARVCGARKFLFTSSGAVYGRQPSHISYLDEDYGGSPNPLDPASVYGEAKRVAELLCTIHAREYSIETKIARCFAFVGPYLPLNKHFAVGNFIRDGLRGGPIRVSGDGTPVRSYLYAADLAVWLWTILFSGRSCRAYNVGSEDAISIGDLAHTVAEKFGPCVAVEIGQMTASAAPRERYLPLTKRARTELSLSQTVSLESAIERTISWYARHEAYAPYCGEANHD